MEIECSVPSQLPENGPAAALLADSVAAVDTLPAAPAKNRGGAPKGHRNSIRSGTDAFTRGRFPRGCSWISRDGGRWTASLRQAIVSRDGSTSIYTEALISSAVTHECRRLLLTRWLRLEADKDKLTITERSAILERIGQASDKRDECLRRLRLDQIIPEATGGGDDGGGLPDFVLEAEATPAQEK